MVTSLYMVSLTILLTFLVLSVVQKFETRRKKLKVEMDSETSNHHSVQPAIAGKHTR